MQNPGHMPVMTPDHIRLPTSLEEDASIIIVGNRGTGTSTLALILSMALQWSLVDLNDLFQQQCGLTRAAFQETHGPIKYREQQSHIMQSLLAERIKRTVIVCGPTCLDGEGPQILRSYAFSHLVVQITRDRSLIQNYSGNHAEKTFVAFSRYVDNALRSCTNCEYHNLFQCPDDAEHTIQDGQQTTQKMGPPSLRLKKVAHNFLVFMNRLLKKQLPGYRLEPGQLSKIQLQPHTYAMEIPLSVFSGPKLDKQYFEPRADVVELIIDIPSESDQRSSLITHGVDIISESIAHLRRISDAPIVYHVTLPDIAFYDSAESSKILQLYGRLLLHGLRLVCDYLTVDLRLPDDTVAYFTSIKASTKIIGHFLDHQQEACGWHNARRVAVYERSRTLQCDLSRILQMATCREDNVEVQSFVARINQIPQPRPELIAYNTGVFGRTSRVFNKKFTPVRFGSSERPQDDSILTLQQAQRALFGAFVLDPLRFSVIGSDISYSLVPDMFHAAFHACGMSHMFTLNPSLSLAGLARQIGEDDYGGGTCAPPFKTSILEYVDMVSPSASLIGAVNTLIPLRSVSGSRSSVRPEARYEPSHAGPVKALFGDNTDWIGIISCIRRSLSPANAIKSDSTALVVGAGGMARAAIFAMMELGIRNVFIFNRTIQNAQRLIQLLKNTSTRGRSEKSLQDTLEDWPTLHILESKVDDWPRDYGKPTVIVSCVPQNTIVELPNAWTMNRTGGVFVQPAYKSLSDPLLKQFEAKASQGWVVQDGLDVLPELAFAQFELFTGRPAPQSVMKETALRKYRDDTGKPLHEHDIQRRLKAS